MPKLDRHLDGDLSVPFSWLLNWVYLLTVTCFFPSQNYTAKLRSNSPDSFRFSTMSRLIPPPRCHQFVRLFITRVGYNLRSVATSIWTSGLAVAFAIRQITDCQGHTALNWAASLSGLTVVSALQITDTPFFFPPRSLMSSGLDKRYSSGSRESKTEASGDKWGAFQRLCWIVKECDVAVCLWDARNIIVCIENGLCYF